MTASMPEILHDASAAQAAAEQVRARLGSDRPVAAIILGSGLGGLANRVTDAVRVPFAEIPGFPSATVAGHAGMLIGGRLAGRRVLALAGRFHMYEGHAAALAAFPTRVLVALGAQTLIVSNAAGGIRRSLNPGDLMLIRDHLNFMFRNPLLGPNDPGEPRFPDMSAPYDGRLAEMARDVARANGIALAEGVYCGLLGPTYETPAEVRMLAFMGADAVGMSTVPEVIVARALGMRVLGISCVTNMACGLTNQPITHAEVIETTTRAAAQFERLITGVVEKL
ncbi:MAG TPA: purine-nucleoside phosphorylase [Gemmatimonadaceae bacterium]|nr:purine-nucleoside phosphorylase [Gemmatimonadaceae bacterium]